MNKKIIILVAPPRSLSTAFLRMMAEREDFQVINEPTCVIFNRTHYPHSSIFYQEPTMHTYAEVKSHLLSSSVNKHIFVKEMSFSFEEFILQEKDFIKNPNVYCGLLLRDPHFALISYYKKVSPHVIDFIINDFATLTGYQALYNVFTILKKEACHSPFIINAHQLMTDTYTCIQSFCRHVNIPYHQKYLHWLPLSKNSSTNKWEENKKQEFINHWHGEALASNGFHQAAIYEVDNNGIPTFSEIQNEHHKKQCIEVYQANKKFYDLMNRSSFHDSNRIC